MPKVAVHFMNENYNLLSRNCVQVTNELLSHGVLNNNNLSLQNIKMDSPIPNNTHICDHISIYSVNYYSNREYYPEVKTATYYQEGATERTGGY